MISSLLSLYAVSTLASVLGNGNIDFEPLVTRHFFDVVDPLVQDAIAKSIIANDIYIPPQSVNILWMSPISLNVTHFDITSFAWGPNSGTYFSNGQFGYSASFSTTIKVDYVTNSP